MGCIQSYFEPKLSTFLVVTRSKNLIGCEVNCNDLIGLERHHVSINLKAHLRYPTKTVYDELHFSWLEI